MVIIRRRSVKRELARKKMKIFSFVGMFTYTYYYTLIVHTVSHKLYTQFRHWCLYLFIDFITNF